MAAMTHDTQSVVSSRVYGLIMGSPVLRAMLLPEGLTESPYWVVDYRAELTLEDPRGRVATFRRVQQIEALQEGISGLLDHAWGDGVLITDYQHSAGQIEDSFKDEGRRHLVIGLKRPMHRGEQLTFQVARTAMEGFLTHEQRLDTTIDHPVGHLSSTIVFPKTRPCVQAWGEYEDVRVDVPVITLANGTTRISCEIARPRQNTSYVLHWFW